MSANGELQEHQRQRQRERAAHDDHALGRGPVPARRRLPSAASDRETDAADLPGSVVMYVVGFVASYLFAPLALLFDR